jgi:hypothetical protein
MIMKPPSVSIVIPYYRKMKNAEFFLKRCIDSIMSQTYEDYEIIITEKGTISQNTNAGLKRAKGDLIKILFMDDYFAEANSLQKIVDNFTDDVNWLITGCNNNPCPYWTDDIMAGNNKLGSPSCLTIRNKECVFFDEDLKWLLDVVYYKELYKKYGKPKIVDGIHINIGVGEHQMTNVLTAEEKLAEVNYVKQKYYEKT